MKSTNKQILATIFAALAAATILLNGCGGGGGGASTSSAPAQPKSKSGSGKLSAVVKLTPPAARTAESTSSSTVTVTITVTGVYAADDKEFTPVTTSTVIDMTAGPAKVSLLDIPVGVNHLVTVFADWGGGASETLKAIVPEINEGELSSSTVDHESTAVAEAAIYIAEKDGKRLTDITTEQIAAITEAVAGLVKNGTPYYYMTPSQVLTFIANEGIPGSASLTPLAPSVVKGQTLQFTAALLDMNGTELSSASFTWTFDTSAVGSVNSSGLFTAAAEGAGILTVTTGSISATTAVLVISNCTTDTQCEDGIPLTYDACTNPGTNTAACTHTTIACAADTDCNDNVTLTLDTCTNPGTLTASCSNTTIACNTNSDCSGGYPICTNGGTLTASCVACAADLDCNDSNALTIDVCVTGAPARAAGAVMTYPYCEHMPIACNTDTDCDDNNASTNDTCTGGGTALAACSNTPIGPTASAISVGYAHTCAINLDGTVSCWGDNFSGQVGYDTGITLPRRAGKNPSRAASGRTTSRSAANQIDGSYLFFEPYTVPGISGVTSLTARASSTCVSLSTGEIKCWGHNGFGQLGNNSTLSSFTPVSVNGITNAVQVTNNGLNTCAILSDGSVMCWGRNIFGQLGDGTFNDSYIPLSMPGLSGPATQVAIGDSNFICVLINDGTVQCVGDGSNGKTGDGNTTSYTPVPVTVFGITNAVAIATGNSHTCALLSDSTVACWGDNTYGQLGDGTQTPAITPVAVSGLTGVTAITAGGDHTCALLSGGTAKCWGSNYSGMLGIDPAVYSNSLLPATVTTVSGPFTAVDAGYNATCFILTGGTYKCIGANSGGNLGNGRGYFNTTPVSEFGLTGITTLSIKYSACALTTAGSLSCWGLNMFYELGTGNSKPYEEPVTATEFSSVAAVAMGGSHLCALTTAGSIQCVGTNYGGQLGDGTNTTSAAAVTVTGLSGSVNAITASGSHTCALINDGSIQCWGYNTYGQLGNATNTDSNIPVTVTGLSGPAIAFTAGDSFTCAIINDGSVQCWGYNLEGQLGNATNTDSNIPVTVTGLSGPVTEITSSGSHTCALINDGSVQCWGYNINGQLGDGTTASSNIPVTVAGITGAADISVSFNNSCALINNGTVKCWGDNSIGNLGNNSITPSLTPVDVYGITDATAIYGGNYRTCANSASRGILCWGADVLWYNYGD